MADTNKTDAEKSADSIKEEEQTAQTPRGNVHSEEEQSPDQDAPPPLPN